MPILVKNLANIVHENLSTFLRKYLSKRKTFRTTALEKSTGHRFTFNKIYSDVSGGFFFWK
jgi:hypothetical protein